MFTFDLLKIMNNPGEFYVSNISSHVISEADPIPPFFDVIIIRLTLAFPLIFYLMSFLAHENIKVIKLLKK